MKIVGQKMLVLVVISILGITFVGCSDTTQDSDDTTPAHSKEVGSGVSDYLFHPDSILQIEITLDSNDWEFVRNQERDISGFWGGDCELKPWDDPYEYRTATIVVNGTTIKNVGVRKKGFVGSVNADKPSLKVKLDKYIDEQELNGLDRLTLNNNISDESHISQCLTYSLFTKAGVKTPRCSFAQVTVNGVYLGLYSHVESIKKRFLSRHFSDNDGMLFEGTMSDFREGWTATFEQKTNKSTPDMSSVDSMSRILSLDSDSILTPLQELIDLDAFLTFWGVEILTNHSDGMSSDVNNYYFYHDPTSQKIYFIPWGADKAMLQYGKFSEEGILTFMNSLLTFKLYENSESRQLFIAKMQRLLIDVWSESEIFAEIDRLSALLTPVVTLEPKIENPYFGDGTPLERFNTAIEVTKEFVNIRRDQVTQFLTSLPDKSEPMQLHCGGDEKDSDKENNKDSDKESDGDDDKSCTEGEVFEEWYCEDGVWKGPGK